MESPPKSIQKMWKQAILILPELSLHLAFHKARYPFHKESGTILQKTKLLRSCTFLMEYGSSVAGFCDRL